MSRRAENVVMRSGAFVLLWMLLVVMALDRSVAEEPIRLRILSYNIHHAKGVDGRLDLERIARVILSVEPDLAALKELNKFWMNATKVPLPTIPVAAPKRQIDFVLCRPENRWSVVEVKVLDESVASDHRPILAVLELLPAETRPQRD